MDGDIAKSRPYGDSGATGVKIRKGSESGEEAREFVGNLAERGAEAYAHTQETLSRAFNKTEEALSDTYERMLVYGRKNPGRSMLMAFGAGAGIGFLLANGGRASHRTSSYVEPVVNAVSQFASELLRRR